eukprot:1281428-Amphidinium_carterae.1
MHHVSTRSQPYLAIAVRGDQGMDPARVIHGDVLREFVFLLLGDDFEEVEIQSLLAHSMGRLARSKEPWLTATTFMDNVVMTLCRLGWSIDTVDTWTSDFGRLVLNGFSLRCIAPPNVGLTGELCTGAAFPRVSCSGRSSRRSARAGGLWTQQTLCLAGGSLLQACQLCGGPGTLGHRIFHCPYWHTLRQELLGCHQGVLQHLGGACSVEQMARLLVPAPLTRPDRPVESEVREWTTGVVGPGDWFTDASALHSGIPHLRAVGWSAVQLTPAEEISFLVSAMLPADWGLDSSVFEGELFAVIRAVELSVTDFVRVHVDNAAVVVGATR